MITPRQVLYYELDYHEVNTLVQQHFNTPDYNCVAAEEWSNDSQHTLTVDLNDYGEDERQEVEHFINGTKPDEGWACALVWLLHDLAEKQKIPVGNYVIEVCW